MAHMHMVEAGGEAMQLQGKRAVACQAALVYRKPPANYLP